MKSLRDKYPFMDELVGYAAHRALLDAGDIMKQYRQPEGDGPFLGRVTSIRSGYEHSIGLVLRHLNDYTVMATGSGVTFWSNVGCVLIQTPEEFSERFRSEIDLRELAAEILAEQSAPCECAETLGALGQCSSCRCHWCRVFPEGPSGPMKSTDTGPCRHIVQANYGNLDYDSFVGSLRIGDWMKPRKDSTTPWDVRSMITQHVKIARALEPTVQELHSERFDEFRDTWIQLGSNYWLAAIEVISPRDRAFENDDFRAALGECGHNI